MWYLKDVGFVGFKGDFVFVEVGHRIELLCQFDLNNNVTVKCCSP